MLPMDRIAPPHTIDVRPKSGRTHHRLTFHQPASQARHASGPDLPAAMSRARAVTIAPRAGHPSREGPPFPPRA
jgi:hypothetical protein